MRTNLCVSVTCAADGHEHWVGNGVDNAHRYPALCGRLVRPAALVTPPGPICPACAAAVDEGHQQQRSLNVLRRLAGFATVQQGKHRRNRALRSVHAS